MLACTEGRLRPEACCVIVASEGYPASYKTGFEIEIAGTDCEIFIAGAKLSEGRLLTSGGRVLGVTATASTLSEAVKKAYAGVDKVRFTGAYHRSDIGARALAAADGR